MKAIAYSLLGTAALAALTYHFHSTMNTPLFYTAFALTVLAFWHTVERVRSALLEH